MDSLLDFLQTFDLKPDLMCLSETKQKHFPFMNLSILNYTFHNFSSASNPGGVAVYISSKFFLKNLTLQCLKTDQSKDLFVKLSDRDGINQFVCGIVYNYPKAIQKFLLKTMKQRLFN